MLFSAVDLEPIPGVALDREPGLERLSDLEPRVSAVVPRAGNFRLRRSPTAGPENTLEKVRIVDDTPDVVLTSSAQFRHTRSHGSLSAKVD